MPTDPVSELRPGPSTDANSLRESYRKLERDGRSARCELCNSEPLTPDLTIAAWPRPWLDDGDAVLCHECWAREAAAETVLDEEQAQVAAVQAVGYSMPEMASAIGGYEDDVQEHIQDLSQVRREVEDEMDDLMRTAKLFGSL